MTGYLVRNGCTMANWVAPVEEYRARREAPKSQTRNTNQAPNFNLPHVRVGGLPATAISEKVCPMSAQEMLLEEIKRQPEPLLLEVLHYLKFLARQGADAEWADLLPSREVEQEVLDVLDRK